MIQHSPSTEFELAPLEPSPQLRYRVKDALIELIISRQLPAGTHLGEVDVARRLQVSRQPVREAFQALQIEGWLELRPGRGAFVHAPTDDEVDETFQMRRILEQEAAALAAQNAVEGDIATLTDLCERGERSARDGDVDTVVELNSALHRHISTMSRNSLLTEFIETLDRRIRWYFTEIALIRGSSSWQEHRKIIDALQDHDPARARRLMRTHVQRSQASYHTT